jgi:hypothetical protein
MQHRLVLGRGLLIFLPRNVFLVMSCLSEEVSKKNVFDDNLLFGEDESSTQALVFCFIFVLINN